MVAEELLQYIIFIFKASIMPLINIQLPERPLNTEQFC